jgi:acyl-CoA thioester hydrolase
MPRIFASHFTVPEDAIDVQGHVNNLKYVAWMQDVAIAHSAGQGWPMDRYMSLGLGWVVRSHFIKYIRPAFAGQSLSLYTWIGGFSPRSSPRKYLFWRAADQTVLAEAETMWVFIDLQKGHPCHVPAEVRDSFDIVTNPDEVLEMARSRALAES